MVTAPVRKRRSLHVIPSSDEETKFDNACLCPPNMCNIVSVFKLLGGIGDVLGDKFFVLGQKEVVVVSSSSMTPPSPFIGSLLVDPGSNFMFGGALGSPGDSSQSEKPSMVDEMKTASHLLSFEVYAPGWRLLGIPYYQKTSPPRSEVVVLIPRPQ